jgi:formamidopyrimidine-DNA glycosylase
VPELGEVEVSRRLAERIGLGKRIADVVCENDPIVFCGQAPEAIVASLTGRRLVATHRKGKYFWFALDARPWPLFHLGMTGAIKSPGVLPLALKAHPNPNLEWPPNFTKLNLVFEDGQELAFTDARRLGRVRMLHDPGTEAPVSELGPDAHEERPSLSDFEARLVERSRGLKALLLDQSFFSGIGNWMADEILFQAGLDPRRRSDGLLPAEQEHLYQALAMVTDTSVNLSADAARFPKEWLFHVRWGRNATARTSVGEQVEFLRIGGRSTAWVPSRQR